ncbi:MAG TPA: outer membrane protein assembly factor BamE [Paracoccus sp. (in: a-proteobacteria)]|uniref:outer membrane protein assembly factor BamE n=1 Tax=uncultured Paracoccus sp. TaxID=189685 RepID=UPI00260937AE|nr:outer membrane protein assembly factor BamE [uncultured Paracoccus sp.]HMQ41457.1 outer membrane protein assembly factor BamE [Paracoccus sp. (in: a-proteobacteria)]HMR37316.1 outer membrane protein assembly factor BamE [Paracoccus sp. (in: a-proteobacteria)]
MLPIRGLVIALTLFVTGCAPIYRNHGYIPPEEDLALIQIGQTSQFELESMIGRPGSQGLLEGSGWFYVGSRWRHYGAMPPREIEREVVAIHFAPDGTVSNVERFGFEQGRIVVLSRRVTQTNVTSTSAIRQVLGNIGNFDPTGALGGD